MSDERLKIWLRFCSTILISGGVAALSLWINSQFQQKELELAENENKARLTLDKNEKDAAIREKRLNLEQNYVTTFLERATEENVENRFRFTRYLSTLTLDPELKAGWSVLFADAEKERAEAKKRLEELEGQTTEEALAEAAILQRELQASRNSSVNVRIISTELSMIQKNAPCPEDTEMVISASETPYLKADYIKWTDFRKDFEIIKSKYGTVFYSIARWCRTQDNKALGDAVIVGPTGAVLANIPVKDLDKPRVFVPMSK